MVASQLASPTSIPNYRWAALTPPRLRVKRRPITCLGAVPATTCSRAMANSSGLKDRPSLTSFRGVVTLYQGSIGYRSFFIQGCVVEGDFEFLRERARPSAGPVRRHALRHWDNLQDNDNPPHMESILPHPAEFPGF